MGFEPCLSALERPTRAVRSETIAVRSFTDSVKSVWASPPIGWRALPGTRAADSAADSSRASFLFDQSMLHSLAGIQSVIRGSFSFVLRDWLITSRWNKHGARHLSRNRRAARVGPISYVANASGEPERRGTFFVG